MIRDFIKGVQQLWYWFPVIWRNRWWDWEFLTDLMVHQLRFMEVNIRKKGIHLYAERDAGEIAAMIKDIEYVIDEGYKVDGPIAVYEGETGDSYDDREEKIQDALDRIGCRMSRQMRGWWD